MPHLTEIHPSKLEVTLLDRFKVSFGVEGGSISLVCSMVVIPDLPNVPPIAQWYRDGETHYLINQFIYLIIQPVVFVHSSLRLHSRPTDKLLKAGKLAEMSVGGGAARLTLPHLAKDDEGLYTLRIFTKDGTAEHSAYLFVSGTSLCIMELFNINQKWTFKAQNTEFRTKFRQKKDEFESALRRDKVTIYRRRASTRSNPQTENHLIII